MIDAATTVLNPPAHPASPRFSVYHFCVACPWAREIYVIGAFNNWSTTATPMTEAERGVWQLSLLMPSGQPPAEFSYFVIAGGKAERSGFGTSILPGCWAVVEESAPAEFRAHADAVLARALKESRRRQSPRRQAPTGNK